MQATDISSEFPLLTIGIPTWNRAEYLRRNLDQLIAESRATAPGQVEILVSDNCSPDHTPQVVAEAQQKRSGIRYIRNTENLGWAKNFIQTFEAARGRYVLMLGDDDVLVDGALAYLLTRLSSQTFGVVCMRPYGFDADFRAEHPGGRLQERQFDDANDFLLAINRCFTLTSALVLNKTLLADVDSRQFIASDLATFHLMIRAAFNAKTNLYVDHYLIGCQRQNSFSYNYAEVFVRQLWSILDAHVVYGLSPKTIRALENNKLLTYYPFYMFDFRMHRRGDPKLAYKLFAERFGERWLFKYWLAPIISWPAWPATAWGAMTTVVGRIANGDLQRGIKFAWNRLRSLPASCRAGKP